MSATTANVTIGRGTAVHAPFRMHNSKNELVTVGAQCNRGDSMARTTFSLTSSDVTCKRCLRIQPAAAPAAEAPAEIVTEAPAVDAPATTDVPAPVMSDVKYGPECTEEYRHVAYMIWATSGRYKGIEQYWANQAERAETRADVESILRNADHVRTDVVDLSAITVPAEVAPLPETPAVVAPAAAPRRIVIIPCGGKKTALPQPAGQLYIGSYFTMCKRAAEAIGGEVFILSGLHGLLPLDQVVAPYEMKMGAKGCVTPAQLHAQAVALGIAEAEVTVIAGKRYANAAAAVWPDATRVLDGTTSMGGQRRVMAGIIAGS